MAKYEIKYVCGHIESKQLFGATSARDAEIARLEARACPACWKAERDAKATEQSTAAGLPELRGSEKQVAWASQIRLEKIKKLRELAEWAVKAQSELEKYGGLEGFIQAAIAHGMTAEEATEKANASYQQMQDALTRWNRLHTETSAQWFIDNR